MGGASFDTAFLSTFLVVVMVGTIVFELVMTFLSTSVGGRLRAHCCAGKQAAAAAVAATSAVAVTSAVAAGGQGKNSRGRGGVRVSPANDRFDDAELQGLKTWGSSGTEKNSRD